MSSSYSTIITHILRLRVFLILSGNLLEVLLTICLERGFHELLECCRTRANIVVEIELWVLLQKGIKLWNHWLKLLRRPHFCNDLVKLLFCLKICSRLSRWKLATSCASNSVVRTLSWIQTLKNYGYPFLNVIIGDLVTSDDLVRLPNLLSLKLHDFVDECLGNSYALFIELRAVLVVNHEHVLMDAQEYLFHI